MIVEIPISSFSKCILLSEYKNDTIKLSRSDFINTLFQYQAPIISKKKTKTLSELLDTHLKFDINTYGWSNKQIDMLYTVGFSIHHYHRNLFLNFIYSRKLLTSHASDAIMEFNEIYGITEDIFSWETQLKTWQRFWKKKKNELAKKPEWLVSKHKLKEQRIQLVDIKLSLNDVSDILSSIESDHPILVKSSKNIKRHIQVFLLKNFTTMTPKEIQQLIKISKTNYYKTIQLFENRMIKKPIYRRVIYRLVNDKKTQAQVL